MASVRLDPKTGPTPTPIGTLPSFVPSMVGWGTDTALFETDPHTDHPTDPRPDPHKDPHPDTHTEPFMDPAPLTVDPWGGINHLPSGTPTSGSNGNTVPTRVGPRPGRIASDRTGTVRLEIVDLILPWLVGMATLAARLLTAAGGPTDWDSSQFAAGVVRFDVTHGRPQPPGYFLYVGAGRLVHLFGPGAIGSLVLVSAVASAFAAGLVVVAGRDLGGRWVGLAAGLLVATSPFAWFSGSIVSTYSFDLMIAPLLIILAWRARPHSWHGAAALGALGLLAGFRQSELQTFALLALLALLGSVRRFSEAVKAVLVGAVAVAIWFVPMALSQPGGVTAWVRATRLETMGAVQATSILDHAQSGAVNVGTFAAYTFVALAPLIVLAVIAGFVLLIRTLVRAVRSDGAADDPIPPEAAIQSHSRRRRSRSAEWTRPWFQSRTAILVAAIVPPMAVVALVEFAKSGYLLAYLPGSIIALLLVPAALLRRDRPRRSDRSQRRGVLVTIWLVVISLAVAGIAVLGAQRFLAGTGVLPAKSTASNHGLWLTQTKYQAPYPATRSAIRSADAIDTSLAALAPLLRPGRDVVVIDTVDGGSTFYRNAGWELPADRVTLVVRGSAIYNEQFGSLFYTSASTIPVGPGGYVYLIAPPSLPGLANITRQVLAVPVHARPIARYLVWRVSPGASILGVRVVTVPGVRPLGSGLGT